MRLFLSISLAVGLVVALAACDAAGPEVTTTAAQQERTPVCHYSPDTDTYELLRVVARGAAAHGRQHDRDYVGADFEGAAVPGMDGFVFDAACQPEAVAPPISACLADAIAKYDAGSSSSGQELFPDPATLSPWTTSFQGPTRYAILHTDSEGRQYFLSLSVGIGGGGEDIWRCAVQMNTTTSGSTSNSTGLYPRDPTVAYFDYLLTL